MTRTATRPALRIPTIALVGRQNSGKTSVLMHLTQTAQHPVNFPGSSVERIEAMAHVVSESGEKTTLKVVDLPGIGSLEPLSPDEQVAVGWLRTGSIDVVCVVADACKLSIELALVKALVQLGRPLVVAMTKVDQAPGTVDADALEAQLGVPVVIVNALAGTGMDRLGRALVAAAKHAQAPTPRDFDPDRLARAAMPLQAEAYANAARDRLDAVLLHRVFGLPILLLVMFGIFQLLFVGADPIMGLIEDGQGAVGDWIKDLVAPGALQSFLVDGLVNGVGSVLVFVPQIVFLMLFVSLLEASGYMARAAFLLDRILSRVGLSGRSFVPLVSSFACAVPGILATRMIDDERERIATIVVAPLMSCSARLPVYVVLIGAFFSPSQAGLVLLGLYAMGIVIAALVAWALRRTKLRGQHSTLMMELPAYQRPSLRVVRAQVWSALKQFLVLAGTIIVTASVIIWVLSYYPRPTAIHERFEAERAAVAADDEGARAKIDAAERATYLEQSFLAEAGKALTPVFAPAGFDWRTTVGVLAAFPARELVIPTLGVLYSLGDVDAGNYDLASLDMADQGGLRQKLRDARDADGNPAWSPLTALAVMVFFALCSQCAATLGAIRRETRSRRWPLFVFGYMTVLAWVAAVAVYQGGRLLGFAG
ncbi:MAG: ferrous iron transport protein B [Myxococcota bacterium]